MRITAWLDTRAHRPLLHECGKLGQHTGIGLRQHAVAEVEDMPAPVARPLEHVERRRFDALPGAEENRRVEVALHRWCELPAELEGDAPVEADHVAACARHDGLRNRWFLDPLHGRGYPADILALCAADAPVVLAGDLEAIAAPTDFLGVNYYFPEIIAHAPGAAPLEARVVARDDVVRTAFGWEVSPEGLGTLIRRIEADYDPAPIYITENGSTWEDVVGADGEIDDVERRDFSIEAAAATPYANNHMQPLYFINDGLEALADEVDVLVS